MPITISRDKTFSQLLQKNLAERYKYRRRSDDLVVHVSDILPSTCLRRQYYSRKYPELYPLTDETVHHFIRGESSEHIITKLANVGAAQVPINSDMGVQGHPDIFIARRRCESGEDREKENPARKIVQNNKDNNKEPVIIELKDNTSGERLDFEHPTFRSYLKQLLYYMVITEVEKGILSIRYNIKELNWVKRDDDGDHFVRPFDAKPVGIESWFITLPLNDIARELIRDQIVERKERFQKALRNNTVEILPRLKGRDKALKCRRCPFNSKCFNEDAETLDAMSWDYRQQQDDPLKMSGVVNVVKNDDKKQ
jgi:hypothetical protein